jgi:hypothetical protein
MRRLPRLLGGVALGIAVVAVPGASDAAPRSAAQAGGPTITVAPADDLVDGQTVEVEVSGMSGDVLIAQCAPDRLDTSQGALEVEFFHCRSLSVPGVSGSVVVPFALDEEYATTYHSETRETRCGGVGPDCFVAAIQTSDYSAVATPVHFGAPRSEPAITVTPASGLHTGDVVQVEVTGFGDERFFHVGQCIGEVATAPDPRAVLERGGACVSFTGGGFWDDPWTASIAVAEAWTWGEADDVQGNRCGDEPGGCVIAAYAPESGTLVTAPLDVDPSPLAVVPAAQEAGYPVQVFASGQPGQTVRVAQCALPVRRTLAASRCSGASTITLDGRGEAMAPFELREEVGRGNRRVRCPAANCAIALFTRSGRRIATSPVVVYPADG